MTDELSDEELVLAYFGGEAWAFECFFKRHVGRTFAYCLRKGLPEEEAHEVTQEIFLRLHTFIHSYQKGKPALPWFFTIVHNCCMDWKRRELRRSEMNVELLPEATRSPEGHLTAIEQKLEKLSATERKILKLRVESELSFKEISSQINKNEAATRKVYSRAVATLKKIFKGEETE